MRRGRQDVPLWEMIRATSRTPGDESCQAAQDNTLPKEQQGLRYARWIGQRLAQG
ncbi:hypothetical protein [Streptomyces griseoflavus]|uniref:hypothetical protein n=1 Tax=Streptomyces griseoflavus TaxID=35619 RepID=UPI003D731F9D